MLRKSILFWLPAFIILSVPACQPGSAVLDKSSFRHLIERFNREDTLNLHVDVVPGTRMVPNDSTWSFLERNIPFFECPDTSMVEIYYYRWWTYRKHIKKTPEGYIITEFMPSVPWARKYNSISCPAIHHFREGRWLHDPAILRDYAVFWLRGGADPFVYSFPLAEALLQLNRIHPDDSLLVSLLPDLIGNYREWERRRRAPDGLFWQYDGQDGMEVAIGGHGKRPTINSYMFADALAIAEIARLKGDSLLADQFEEEASRIRTLVLEKLWDPEARFFKVIPESDYIGKDIPKDSLSTARELLGYLPWYVNLPPKGKGYEAAWVQLTDTNGFRAPFGPTTAERRHPGFRVSYEGHECQWNGPSWPFATSQTLTALANVLNDYPQDFIGKEDFLSTLDTYTASHRFRQIPPTGDTIVSDSPWIDENLNPLNGDWLARTRMEVQGYNHAFRERGIYYNHSTYNDIIITGLAGLRPSSGDTLTVNPLVPEGWDWFCLDDIPYKGHRISIIWDRNGKRYHLGAGLQVRIDGRKAAWRKRIGKLEIHLDPSAQ